MASKQRELALECKRQYESCLYTSTALFIWLRCLRTVRVAFIILPLVFGSLGTWKLLTTSNLESTKILAAVCSFLAGLLPTVYAALKFDASLECCKQLASEFKNLQDRFRQAALVSSQKPFADFEADFQPLMKQLEAARSHSYTAPEWCFKRAQSKIKAGDYEFEVDVKEEETDRRS
jgi:hypothetical protein